MTTTNGSDKRKAVIVGAGIYGMSTALWMLKSGNYEVTILDKCGILPAPDAASTDINKIIRAGDYAEGLMAKLSVEAEGHWKRPEWQNTYHESGCICVAGKDDTASKYFVDEAIKNLQALNLDVSILSGPDDFRNAIDPTLPPGVYDGKYGYKNRIGGWAESGRALEVGLAVVRQMGGTIRSGADVVGLIKEGRRVKGVTLKDGEEVLGDLVVAACGAWTPGFFAQAGVKCSLPPMVASGNTIATIQLAPEEIERYKNIPVILEYSTGFYTFPPNATGLVKVAYHSYGYTNPIKVDSTDVSVPRTKLTPGAEDGMIPQEMIAQLRHGLAQYYPELAKKDFVSTRLCWYCDTKSDEWLIDYHPDFDNLVVAAGDCGHAFKFTPIIGREILKLIEGKLEPEYKHMWSWAESGKPSINEHPRHGGARKVLKVNELAKADDLRAPISVAA